MIAEAETEKWQQAVYCQRCGRFITMVHTASSTRLLTALFALRLGCVCALTAEEISSILLAPHGGCPAVRTWANRVKSALRALQLPEEEVQWATATMWPLSEGRRLQMIRAREAKGKANE